MLSSKKPLLARVRGGAAASTNNLSEAAASSFLSSSSSVQEVSSIKRLVTKSNKIRRLLWIVTFCKEEPGLRRLAFWAQGFGTIAHPALFVRHEDDGAGYRLHVDRDVKQGTTLLSVPLPTRHQRHTSVYAISENDISPDKRAEFNKDSSPIMQAQRSIAYVGTAVGNDLTQLVYSATRGVTDGNHPQHDYLKFLHDHYNPLQEEGYDAPEHDDDDGDYSGMLSTSGDLSPPPMVGDDFYNTGSRQDDREAAASAVASYEMRRDVDAHTRGTAITVKGVPNAPYLPQDAFDTARGRAEHVRLQRVLRDVQQAMPYFSVAAVPWALSMVMSRAIGIPELPPFVGKHQTVLVPPSPLEELDPEYGLAVDTGDDKTTDKAHIRHEAEATVRHLYTTVTAGQGIAGTRSETMGATRAMAASSATVDAQRLSMVPLMDFCNHSTDPTAHYAVTFPGSGDVRRHEAAVERRRALRRARKLSKGTRRAGSSPSSASAAPPPRNEQPGKATTAASSRMLTPVVGVKGWHYWKPCVHLIAVKDIPKYGEVTLKYCDDGLWLGGDGNHSKVGGGASDEDMSRAATIAEGFMFRYGFVPSRKAGTPASGHGATSRRKQGTASKASSRASSPAQTPSLLTITQRLRKLLKLEL